MNKSFVIAGLACFVLFFAWGFVVHGMLLQGVYEASADLYRPAESMADVGWALIAAYALMGFTFAYIYGQNHEGKGMGEGIRFGFVAGLFLASVDILSYGVYPTTLNENLSSFAVNVLMCIVGGIVANIVYEKTA